MKLVLPELARRLLPALSDPRLLVLLWAVYALCLFAWFGYQDSLSGFFCET